MANVWLVDIDSKIPNLALMKLAAYHISKGDTVELLRRPRNAKRPPDRIYVSCIFTWNNHKLADYLHLELEGVPVSYGGPGHDPAVGLPEEVEKHPPHLELFKHKYGDKPWIIGYTHRGCIRTCEFCVVPQESIRMFGRKGIQRNTTSIADMLEPHPGVNRAMLLDNNFLAKPDAVKEMQYCIDHKVEISFSQGLDIRLIASRPGKEKARTLAQVRFRSSSFKSKLVNFAYDSTDIAEQVEQGVAYLQEAGISTRNDVQFYVLVGFDSSFEDDLRRIAHLRSMGVAAFVMVYRQPRGDFTKGTPHPLHRKLARWANRPQLYWSCEFDEFMLKHPDQQRLEVFNV